MSPAGKKELKCFAVKRGEIEHRLDCQFHLPEHHYLETQIRYSSYPVFKLGDPQISKKIVDGPFGSQLKVEEYKKSGIPLIRVANCRDGEIRNDGLVYISEEKHQQLIRSEVLPGDVLLTKAGVLGDAAVFPNYLKKGNITSHLASIRPTNDVNPNFLATYLSSTFGIKQIYRWGNKTTRPELNTDEVRELLIIVPPLSIQKKLVSEMVTAREDRKRKLHKADELLGSLDEWLMERLGLTPAPADERTVFALRLEQFRGRRIDVPAYRPFFAKGHLPKTPLTSLSNLAGIDIHRLDSPEDENELVPYVGLPECKQTEVREVVMRPYHEVKGRSVVKPGDILFARIEPSIFNKKYVFVEDLKGHEYAYTSTEFYVVTPNHSETDPHYLYAMFFCSFVFNQVKGKTTGSSGRRRLDPELFRNLKFPKPSIKMQQTIATEVRRRRTEARRLRAEAEAEWESAKISFEEKLLGSRV